VDLAHLRIWLKPQRNDLLSETVENEEFDFTGLFEEDDAAMSASDPLMSHTGSDIQTHLSFLFSFKILSCCIVNFPTVVH
jgi:hypothetical protein